MGFKLSLEELGHGKLRGNSSQVDGNAKLCVIITVHEFIYNTIF